MMNGEREARISGTPASAAIIVGLAADMLSREKVRTKLVTLRFSRAGTRAGETA